jgi:predicted lipoprotein with Yx(FWY)xxD motif
VHGRWTGPLGFLVIASLLGGCAGSTMLAHSTTNLGYEIAVGHVPGLGSVVVSGSDMTLYLYVPDDRGASRCTRICAVDWPPLISIGGKQSARFGPGIDPALVGSVRRAGGSLQVTYNGWPLYRFGFETGPGAASGEGDDMGLWYAVSPTGEAVR